MNNNLTEMAVVLDRSGSMQSCVEAAISGFNTFLRDQRAQPGEARITLVLFNDQYETPWGTIPLAEATELDTTTYVPRGSTALLDAIGRTIDDCGARLAAMPEEERPATVLVAILTDGLENSSRQFTWKDISEKIALQRDTYKWEFLFLGANQDAIATAAQISIGAHMSASYAADAAGSTSSFRSTSRKMSALRFRGLPQNMTPAMQADLDAPLTKIQEEEDAKLRGEKKDKE